MVLFIGNSLRTMTATTVRTVSLDWPLAAPPQAGVADTVLLSPRTGARPVPLKVTGVAVVSAGDTLFQPLIPLLGPAPASPPADVAIMPFASFVKPFGSTAQRRR